MYVLWVPPTDATPENDLAVAVLDDGRVEYGEHYSADDAWRAVAAYIHEHRPPSPTCPCGKD